MTQFTKRAIVEAFVGLLNDKPLDKITVKAIVDACGISRNTFYYHFEDIHQLLLYVLDTEVERVIAQHSDTHSLEEGFIEAAHFALSNKRAVYHIYNSVSREALENYMNRIAEEVVRRIMDETVAEGRILQEDRELLIHFYKHGLVGLAMDWTGAGMKVEPERLIRSLGGLLDGSLEAEVEKSRVRSGRK